MFHTYCTFSHVEAVEIMVVGDEMRVPEAAVEGEMIDSSHVNLIRHRIKM